LDIQHKYSISSGLQLYPVFTGFIKPYVAVCLELPLIVSL
jgi:hypothetical protein